MRRYLFSLAMAAFAVPAFAGDLTVEVRDQGGQPVKDAVVLVRLPGATGSARASGPLVMTQQDISFNPHVLLVPLGATVAFPNKDRVRHHVYSFSAAKRFELKLYGREEARTVTFDKAGPVPLGCNIHDQMIGYIYVADTPYAAKTGADGVAVLRGVPAGAGGLTVWHPELRAKTPASRPISVTAAAQRQAAAVDLRPAGNR